MLTFLIIVCHIFKVFPEFQTSGFLPARPILLPHKGPRANLGASLKNRFAKTVSPRLLVIGLLAFSTQAALAQDEDTTCTFTDSATQQVLKECKDFAPCGWVLNRQKNCADITHWVERMKAKLQSKPEDEKIQGMDNEDLREVQTPDVKDTPNFTTRLAELEKKLNEAIRHRPQRVTQEKKGPDSDTIYQGPLDANNNPQGDGVLIDKDGEIKGGTFDGNRINGLGQIIYSSGGSYVGNVSGDKPNGPGIYVATNGVIFDGNFVNGELNGLIRQTAPDGSSRYVIYDHGTMGEQTPFVPAGQKPQATQAMITHLMAIARASASPPPAPPAPPPAPPPAQNTDVASNNDADSNSDQDSDSDNSDDDTGAVLGMLGSVLGAFAGASGGGGADLGPLSGGYSAPAENRPSSTPRHVSNPAYVATGCIKIVPNLYHPEDQDFKNYCGYEVDVGWHSFSPSGRPGDRYSVLPGYSVSVACRSDTGGRLSTVDGVKICEGP